MTDFQRILIDRLRLEFGVDTSPAELLSGDDLAAWLDQAEDVLFQDLIQSLGEAKA